MRTPQALPIGIQRFMSPSCSRSTHAEARRSSTRRAIGQSADIYSYGIPQDEAARTAVGSADVAQTTATTLTGPTFTFAPAPYSATVIMLSQARHATTYPVLGIDRHVDD